MSDVSPFDFANGQLGEGAVLTSALSELALSMEGSVWAYACVFPADKAVPGACMIALKARVEAGEAAIGLLAPSGRYFVSEQVVSRGEDVVLRFPVPPHSGRGPLIVRKASDRLCRLRLQPLGTEPNEGTPAHPIDAWFEVSDMLLKSGPAPPEALAALRVDLRRLASLSGAVVLEPGDTAFEEWFDGLDDDVLAKVAQAQTVPASGAPLVDWTFDAALTSARPQDQLRSALWRAMRRRCPQAVLRLPWLEETHAAMPLGSDLSLALFTQGRFEPNFCAALTPLLKPGGVFLDVGANEGLYTLLAARRLGADGLVVAIEPSARELTRLRRNIVSNGFEGRAVVIEAAVGRSAGWASFAVADDAHSGQNAFADRIAGTVDVIAERPVPLTTLDAVAERLAPRTIDVVKIDVEGAEGEALEGASKLLQAVRPIWFVEVARDGDQGDAAVATLRSAGYGIFGIDDRAGVVRKLAPGAKPTPNVIAVPVEQEPPRWPHAVR